MLYGITYWFHQRPGHSLASLLPTSLNQKVQLKLHIVPFYKEPVDSEQQHVNCQNQIDEILLEVNPMKVHQHKNQVLRS